MPELYVFQSNVNTDSLTKVTKIGCHTWLLLKSEQVQVQTHLAALQMHSYMCRVDIMAQLSVLNKL